jgi:hypothetical protein
LRKPWPENKKCLDVEEEEEEEEKREKRSNSCL